MSCNNEIELRPFLVHQVSAEKNEIPDGVQMIEAPEFWKESDQGKGTVVAILDTGISRNHPDLKDQIIGGKNFTSDYKGDKDNFEDNNGHGSHVAGTIAAILNNGGVVGVAPSTKLLILKVLTGEGSGNYDWIIDAIKYAADWKGPNGETVSVMNMSLGGPQDVKELHEAIKYAVNEKNIPIVCAAGNEGDDDLTTYEYDYPASYNEVISVGAVDTDYHIAPFTNVNEEVDLVAPGVDIQSTYLGSQYAKLSGTSMASPHVTGALALVKVMGEREFGRKLTEAELYAQLIKRTVPLEYTRQAVGNGLVQLKYMDKYRELVKFIQANF
ncbi:S8 family peptidase [Priestia megaterium]